MDPVCVTQTALKQQAGKIKIPWWATILLFLLQLFFPGIPGWVILLIRLALGLIEQIEDKTERKVARKLMRKNIKLAIKSQDYAHLTKHSEVVCTALVGCPVVLKHWE